MLRTDFYLRCLLYIIFVGYGTSDRLCVYHKDVSVKYSPGEPIDESQDEEPLLTQLLNNNSTELCPESTMYCYALWQEDPQNKSAMFVMVQGCWNNNLEECEQNECRASRRRSKISNNTKFCCCSGDFCNSNVTDVPYLDEIDDVQPAQFVEHASYQKETVVIILSSICTLVMISVLIFLLMKLCSASHKPSPDSVHLMEAPLPTTPTFDLESLKIQENIGQGHYSSVCRGLLHNHTVAVKIFMMQNRQYFLNERDIYSLPFMDHPSLPKFIGAEERLVGDGKIEYLLVLTYAPLGSLYYYLTNNTIDWPTLCKMAQTITQGLSYLHTEIRKGDKIKMCIAHRDLTSRNILVQNDGSCMLCDFGFAIRVSGSKYYQNGEKQTAETSSLADVGTLRYMAPEVLEGAVNLRDCESSLKQIDVYALGLILWEIATRCSDLFQGMEVPNYKSPFEAEVGTHPTMEQMQVLVAKHKARPLFPDIWKDTNPAVRALKETIEDCWDQDAEARLTALCAEERLLELPHLWERHKAGMTVPGVSPTINPTYGGHSFGGMHGGVSSSSSSSQAISIGITSDLNDRYLLHSETPNNMSMRNIERASSTSENTVETLLTMSPTDSLSSEQQNNFSTTNMKNNLASNSANKCPRVSVPLQPHQGRNPCIERNLMIEPVEEVSISGNMLLDRKLKFKEQTSNFTDQSNDADLFDVLHMTDSIESNALVTNDILNHSSRNCHPIPYVQNAVHLATTMPKQPNLPGNGHHSSLVAGGKSDCKRREKWWKPFGIFERNKQGVIDKNGIKFGFKNFLSRKGKSENRQVIQNKSFSGNNISVHQNTTSDCFPTIKELYVNKLDKSREPIETEVCIVNKGQNSTTTQTVIRRAMTSLPQNSLVAAKSIPNEQEKMGMSDNFGNVVIHKDVNGNCSNDIPKRPTTLPVRSYGKSENSVRHESLEDKDDIHMVRRGNSGRQKIVKRVKTPFEIKKGRFSLYDDRIMVSESFGKKTAECQLNGASKISLSLPLNIDTVCASQVASFIQECHKTKQAME